ncbi:hypothetical protein AD23_1519 [Escherichia coli 2-005-03_S4_C3]|uniref:Uncharacterized protein n=1 Tax=Escherichia coli O81 (strain ED1a) TaxID=585397 RepID=B7N036_ECO81|nr:hypothetical protein AD23_1519 [Escherichia coli 2-005-03_S4_C3]KDT32975.1 hypothetical protein AC67_5297 [Escherichia coli 2-052-05_S4_C1]CAR09704.2 hypothetical protein ECED1_3552 [Escherichia coli ED1a]
MFLTGLYIRLKKPHQLKNSSVVHEESWSLEGAGLPEKKSFTGMYTDAVMCK